MQNRNISNIDRPANTFIIKAFQSLTAGMAARNVPLLSAIFALVFVLAFSFAWITSGFAQGEAGYVEFVRALGSDETGHSAPAGLAFSPKTKAFYILEAQPQGQALASVSKFDSLAGRLGSTQIAA